MPKGLHSRCHFSKCPRLLGPWESKACLSKAYAETGNVHITTRNVECEGDGDTMQLIHIILSQRCIWGFMLAKENVHLGMGMC